MNRVKLNQSGFTLIEIIVVFSIIAILSVIGVASFVNYSRVQTVEGAAADLSSYFVVAKSRSSAQVKPTSQAPLCDDTKVLNGYKVIICQTSTSDVLCSDSNSYVLAVVCSDPTVSSSPSNPSYKIDSRVLPKNVTFSPAPTTTTIFFPLISSGVQGPGIVSVSGYGYTKTITVNSVGGIQIQ